VFSGCNEPLLAYTLDADYFTELPRHRDEVALITTADEGAALARSLGAHFAVLMANHGVTFCGTSVEHATCIGVFLEKACRAHLLGKAAGMQPNRLPAHVRAKRHAQIMTPAHIEHSWDYFCRML
jgi:ribulose-5-phosphate 4-epimerase/fuculose-1-phosphate aldolase